MKSDDHDNVNNDYVRYGAHPHLSGLTLEWPAWVIMADTEPVQNISSRVRSVIISCHEHNTDHLPQLPGAAVHPGLQQGILPSQDDFVPQNNLEISNNFQQIVHT